MRPSGSCTKTKRGPLLDLVDTTGSVSPNSAWRFAQTVTTDTTGQAQGILRSRTRPLPTRCSTASFTTSTGSSSPVRACESAVPPSLKPRWLNRDREAKDHHHDPGDPASDGRLRSEQWPA